MERDAVRRAHEGAQAALQQAAADAAAQREAHAAEMSALQQQEAKQAQQAEHQAEEGAAALREARAEAAELRRQVAARPEQAQEEGGIRASAPPRGGGPAPAAKLALSPAVLPSRVLPVRAKAAAQLRSRIR